MVQAPGSFSTDKTRILAVARVRPDKSLNQRRHRRLAS